MNVANKGQYHGLQDVQKEGDYTCYSAISTTGNNKAYFNNPTASITLQEEGKKILKQAKEVIESMIIK